VPLLSCLHLCLSCNRFATRISNVFVIGRGNKPLVTLPKGKGVRPTILQEQAKRFGSA
jgi:small subunit ribosomal protein S4e